MSDEERDQEQDDREPNGDPPPEKGGEDKDVEYWKRRSRENEAKARANAEAARQLAEIQESQKTESQKQAEAQQALVTRAENAERDLIRYKVALRKGLSEPIARRLQGDTEEELEADADELLATLKPSNDGDEGGDDDGGAGTGLPRRPQERMRSGSRPNAEPQPSASELVDKMMEHSF